MDRVLLPNLSFIKSEAVMYPFSFDKTQSLGMIARAIPNVSAP
jgi:hypothetical protein